jgi:hypothetical protein
MLMTAASFTIALDAVRDSLVESSAAGPGTVCAESSCGCKMPNAPHDDLVAPPDFLELRKGEVCRFLLGTPVDRVV